MIDYQRGNLLDADAEALVNTVNTVGVSGKGVALMFKEAFPENFRAYAAASKAGEIAPGGLFVTERRNMLGPRWIVNFATKDHWRSPSRLEWIKAGLADLRREVIGRGIRSIGSTRTAPRANARTVLGSRRACGPCATATRSWSGSSTASGATSPISSRPCGTLRRAVWVSACSPARASRSTPGLPAAD